MQTSKTKLHHIGFSSCRSEIRLLKKVIERFPRKTQTPGAMQHIYPQLILEVHSPGLRLGVRSRAIQAQFLSMAPHAVSSVLHDSLISVKQPS